MDNLNTAEIDGELLATELTSLLDSMGYKIKYKNDSIVLCRKTKTGMDIELNFIDGNGINIINDLKSIYLSSLRQDINKNTL